MLSCLSALCQLLLGPGKFRGHVRLVCGLLLLHMMMTQISLLLRGAPPAVTDAAFVTNVLTEVRHEGDLEKLRAVRGTSGCWHRRAGPCSP